MNQDDKQINVKLFKEDEVDFLEFNLGSGKIHKLNINLEDNQGDIKAMFCDLVSMLDEGSIQLVLEVQEAYDNKLLKEVAESYVADLNKEIENVRLEITDKYES